GEALKRMRPDAVLVAIELNPDFVSFIEEEFPDERLRVVHASAKDVRKVLAQLELPNADYIISGIPFTNIPADFSLDIVQEARQALQAEGAWLFYQFRWTVLPYLESRFGSVQENFQLWNILPARIFYCTP